MSDHFDMPDAGEPEILPLKYPIVINGDGALVCPACGHNLLHPVEITSGSYSIGVLFNCDGCAEAPTLFLGKFQKGTQMHWLMMPEEVIAVDSGVDDLQGQSLEERQRWMDDLINDRKTPRS